MHIAKNLPVVQTKKNIVKLGIGDMGAALEGSGLRVKYSKSGKVARVGGLPWIGAKLYEKIMSVKEIEDEKNAMRDSINEELKAAGRDFGPEERKEKPVEKPVETIQKTPEERKAELVDKITGTLTMLKFEISMTEDRKPGVSENGNLVIGGEEESAVIVASNGKIASVERIDLKTVADNISTGFETAMKFVDSPYPFERRKAGEMLAIVRDEIGSLKVELRKEAGRIAGDLHGTRKKSDVEFAKTLSSLTGKDYSAEDIREGFMHTSKQELHVNGCLRSAGEIGDAVDELRALLRAA